MPQYDFIGTTLEGLHGFEEAVLCWAASKDRNRWGPTLGYDNGLMGWQYQAVEDRKDDRFLRFSFTIHGEPPDYARRHIRVLSGKLREMYPEEKIFLTHIDEAILLGLRKSGQKTNLVTTVQSIRIALQKAGFKIVKQGKS